MDAAGRTIFQADVTNQPIITPDKFPNHQHGYFQQFFAMIPEENIIIIPPSPLFIIIQKYQSILD